jgi:hypothetical protein
MPIVTRENVVVQDVETDIIEPQETDKMKDRIFSVSNGAQEIEIKAHGSNDGGATWEERGSKIIPAGSNDTLVVGIDVFVVKLTGKTTAPGPNSTVDASLVW